MKAEILPFTNSLKDLCTAIRSFAQAQDAMQKNDMQSAFDLYMAGSGSYATSQTYTKEMYIQCVSGSCNSGIDPFDPSGKNIGSGIVRSDERLCGRRC